MDTDPRQRNPLGRIRRRIPGHTTVVAYLALFVALGGTSVAALSIGSRQIKDNSVRARDLRNNDVRGRDLRDNTITGRDVARNRLGGRAIKESTLGTVPRATEADRLNGTTAAQLKTVCPAETTPKAGTCFETARPNAPYAAASTDCANKGRRLPTQFELRQFAQGGGGVSPAGEWTSSVFESRTTAGQLDTVLVTSSGGELFAQAGGAAARPYRCVASPAN